MAYHCTKCKSIFNEISHGSGSEQVAPYEVDRWHLLTIRHSLPDPVGVPTPGADSIAADGDSTRVLSTMHSCCKLSDSINSSLTALLLWHITELLVQQ